MHIKLLNEKVLIEKNGMKDEKNFYLMLTRFIALVFIFSSAIMLFGCSHKVVHIPTMCDLPAPEKPEASKSVLEDNLNILEYASFLEEALNYCRGKK